MSAWPHAATVQSSVWTIYWGTECRMVDNYGFRKSFTGAFSMCLCSHTNTGRSEKHPAGECGGGMLFSASILSSSSADEFWSRPNEWWVSDILEIILGITTKRKSLLLLLFCFFFFSVKLCVFRGITYSILEDLDAFWQKAVSFLSMCWKSCHLFNGKKNILRVITRIAFICTIL